MLVVVALTLKVKDPLSVFDLLDIFTDAGADEMVLEPSVRSFDLAFGLGGEGVDGFDKAVFNDHLPLRIDVVGKFLKTHVSLISSFDITKDGMAIGVIS